MKQISTGHTHPRRRKVRRRIGQTILAFFTFLPVFSYLTNPFMPGTVVQSPVTVELRNNELALTSTTPLSVYDTPLFRRIAFLKAGWHIATVAVWGGKKMQATTLPDVIAKTHAARFDPSVPYIISGDHFSILYPRSLGIFYHTALDPRTALNDSDWYNRQAVYLKTTAYALETFAQADRLSTTIVPVGPNAVTLVNIYSPPSDTLYSLLYALRTLTTSEDLVRMYPFESTSQHTLQTRKAAVKLLETYRPALQRHLTAYLETVQDPQTSLVRGDIQLSGTKDSVKRTSAFYDNVILWKTQVLAQQLGITGKNPQMQFALKQKIIELFWDENGGYFREDLSNQAENYSSDWLIAVMTGFLDLADPNQRQYAARSVAYIQSHGLDIPFALKYQPDSQQDELHGVVRLLASSYAASAIWSHWGMEYTKLLVRLSGETCDTSYLTRARNQLAAYEKNIVKYKGFPELYNAKGTIYALPFYKSVRATGWIVNFEQAEAMTRWAQTSPAGCTTL